MEKGTVLSEGAGSGLPVAAARRLRWAVSARTSEQKLQITPESLQRRLRHLLAFPELVPMNGVREERILPKGTFWVI